jgi:hypothetical protein
LAARLLGYGEDEARIAMSAAYAEGWLEPRAVGGEPGFALVEHALAEAAR